MDQDTQTPSPHSGGAGPQSFLTTPVAIVIAGALIALAVYASGGLSSSSAGNGVAGTADTGGSGQAAAAADTNTGGSGNSGNSGDIDMEPVSSDDHIRGPEDAKVTIVEYSDLECPFCQRFHGTLQQAREEFPDEVRWVYRHAPLEQLHSKAPAEANAAECAGEQGKFWPFVDKIFEVSPGNDGLNLDNLAQYAGEVGVSDIQQFQQCVDSNKYADKVDAQLKDAQSAGLRGTPYSVVIGPDGEKQPLSGAQPYSKVKSTIESLL